LTNGSNVEQRLEKRLKLWWCAV